MSYLVISLVLILDLLLAALVLFKARRNTTNVFFVLMALFTGIWTASNFLENEPRLVGMENLEFLLRVDFFFGIYMMALLYLFIKNFNYNKKVHWLHYVFVGAYVTTFAIISFATNLVITEISFYDDIIHFKDGPLWIFYGGFIFFCLFASLFILIRRYRRSFGLAKEQLKFVLFGFGISFTVVVVVNVVLQTLNLVTLTLSRFALYSFLFLIGSSAYAIIKYRMMDIRLVIKRSTVFAFLVAIIAATYSLVVILSTNYLNRVIFVNPVLFTGVMSGVLIALAFDPLKRFLQTSTDRIFFKGDYDPQRYVNYIGNILSHSLDLHKIVITLVDSFKRTFKAAKVALMLVDTRSGFFKVEANTGFRQFTSITFHDNHPLVKYFKTNEDLVIVSELQRYVEDGRGGKPMEVLYESIKNLGVALFLPLIHRTRIIGIVAFSEKKSGDIFSQKDIQTLKILSNQAAITFVNAKLYQETKQFNVILRQEVERAVADLKIANEQLSTVNIKLQDLDKQKSEFISIASHQLRTPLTIIKGYISMILEGNFGKLTKKEIEALDKVFVSNERLINLVEDLLNVSRIEGKRMQYEFKEEEFSTMVESVVDELQPNADQKKLELSYSAKNKIPKLVFDPEKLRQVVFNLVDNAIKYTNQGFVKVSVEEKNGEVELQVTDSGIGITKEGIGKLFEKFSRIKEAATRNTEGTGLGLFVAKKIAEAHKGDVWVTSPGPGKGSTFHLKLLVESGLAIVDEANYNMTPSPVKKAQIDKQNRRKGASPLPSSA